MLGSAAVTSRACVAVMPSAGFGRTDRLRPRKIVYSSRHGPADTVKWFAYWLGLPGGRRNYQVTTVLTATATTVDPSTTPAALRPRPHVFCPGSLGVGVARRCLRGTVAGGPAVTVYSPPMTRNRPELSG